MVKFYPKFFLTLGRARDSTIYVKNSSGDWIEFEGYEYFKVIKKQNQVSEFEIQIVDIQAAEKLYVKEFAEVLFLSENNLILKGRIQKITYETAYQCLATGFGMESKLLEKEMIKSNNKRVQYTNESAQTVANEILSTNTTGAAPWIIEPNTTGLFDTDYGDVSVRYEYGNRLNSIAKLAEAIDYEWSVTQDDDYSDDLFNVATLLPTTTRATVSQETFAITGASANCAQTFHEKDITNLANKIDVLGYGDGVNQLHTSTYNASETYSTLSADITAAAATISLNDASSFAATGEIRIAEERITYTGKAGNDLTGCTRGTSSTTAYAHKKNVYVEKYVAIASAEANSSIGTNGLMDLTITERDIIDLATLELIASRKLLEKMDVIVRIRLIPDEPLEVAGGRSIGDLITITDAESDISGDFRIVGLTYISNYGDLSLEIEASNRTLNFIEQMKKQKEKEENLAKYMQGATNIYAINEAENCDAVVPLNLRFYVPDEAIAINKVLLSFKLEDYRAYSTTSAVNSANSTVVDYDSGTESFTTIFGDWVEVLSLEVGNSDCDGVFINFGMFLEAWTNPLTEIYKAILINITDGINHLLFTGYICGGVVGVEDTCPLSGHVGTFIPGNHKNKTFTIEIFEMGHNGGAYDFRGYGRLHAFSRHTHAVDFAITEEALVTPSVDLSVGAEGAEVAVGTYTTDQTKIDITEEVADVGTGSWVNIKFDSNKRMRIEANAYVQIFIESKS